MLLPTELSRTSMGPRKNHSLKKPSFLTSRSTDYVVIMSHGGMHSQTLVTINEKVFSVTTTQRTNIENLVFSWNWKRKLCPGPGVEHGPLAKCPGSCPGPRQSFSFFLFQYNIYVLLHTCYMSCPSQWSGFKIPHYVGEEYNACGSALCNFLRSPVFNLS